MLLVRASPSFSRWSTARADVCLCAFAVNSGRKLTRHETPKRFQLLRIENKDPKEPLLPILSDDPDVLVNHPLRDFFINASSSDGAFLPISSLCVPDPDASCPVRRHAVSTRPIGPWHLDGLLQLPDCSSKLCVSTNHEKANISISHTLKIMMRVERGDDEYLDSKGNRKVRTCSRLLLRPSIR